MQLGKVTYKNITEAPRVRKRLALARRALDSFKHAGTLTNQTLQLAEVIRSHVAERTSDKLGLYLAWGGDIATLVALGIQQSICIDDNPLMKTGRLPTTIDFLVEALTDKRTDSYLSNSAIANFGEIGIVALFDILSLGGKKIEIHQASGRGNSRAFYIAFNLNEARYEVHFIQRYVTQHENLMSSIREIPIGETLPPVGVVLVKAGIKSRAQQTVPYECVQKTASDRGLPDNTLIISDKPLSSGPSAGLAKVQSCFPFHLRYARFGYLDGKIFLYRTD